MGVKAINKLGTLLLNLWELILNPIVTFMILVVIYAINITMWTWAMQQCP